MRAVPLATLARGPARRDPGDPHRGRPRAGGAGAVGPAYNPIRPALDTFLAELERIPTNDPALRGGRAGWRTEIDIIRRLPSTPDPCAHPAGLAPDGPRAGAARRFTGKGMFAGVGVDLL